jgi:hypothetical protein
VRELINLITIKYLIIMNKNLVNYPIRFGTLLLAGASLAACSKTTFTETDAFRLETNRLRVARQIDSLSRVQAQTDRVALLNWQNAVDQLEKANAGGKVFYTVIPVRGTDMVSGSGGNTQGGRTENAVATAVVTVTQFGRVSTVGMTSMPSGNGGGPIVVSPTPGNNVNHSQNGVFTFGDLRSGEITVNITAPNHTEVNYVANLTPDGGVPNNSTIYVGNVVPLFEISGTAANMATIRGNVYYEGDLTNDREEPLRTEIFNPTSVANNQTAIVTAAIDVTRNDGSVSGLPYFHQRFLAESNGEGVNSFGVPVRSGAIQRIAYSAAPGTTGVGRGNLTNVASDQGSGLEVGAYSMLVPSTAGGLPIQLRFAEFAAYRTYYNNRGQLVPNRADRVVVGGPRPERFLYGPTVVPTDVPVGASRPLISIQAFTTQAAATVVFTPEVPGVYTDNFTPRNNPGGPGGTDAQVRIFGGGVYLTAPTVTVTGTNTSAASFTAATVIVPAATLPLAANSTVAGYVTSVGTQPTAAQLAASDWAHMTVTGVNVRDGGAGYAANDTRLPLTFTRTDVVANVGFGGQFSATGGGGGGALVAINSFAQVIDGGAGFLPSSYTASVLPLDNVITSGGTFTNFLPTVVFTETDAPNSANPTVGYTPAPAGFEAATARIFVDYNATYGPGVAGTSAIMGGNTANGGVGAIQEVRILTPGRYPSGSLPFINFSFGEQVSTDGFLPDLVPANSKNLFISGGPGVVKFNTGPAAITPAQASILFGATVNTITNTTITFTEGWGSRYTFVPTVQIRASDATRLVMGAAVTSALEGIAITTSVNNNPNSLSFGKIVRIVLGNSTVAGLNTGADNNDFLIQAPFSTTPGTHRVGIRVEPSRYGNTLRVLGRVGGAQTLSIGTGLNSYSYNNANTTLNADVARIAAAANGIVSNTQAFNGANPNDIPIVGTSTGVLGGTAQQVGYLFGNEMLLAFAAPTAVAVGNAFAWGVPVLNNTNSPTGNTLIGGRILNPGSGYASPVVSAGNFTSNAPATLVPNPWFRGNRVTLSGNGFNNVAINSPLDIAQANGPLGLTGAAALLPGDIIGFLGAIANASGDIRRTQTAATAAFLDFTITNVGAGYAQAPDAIVFGGGLDLTNFTFAPGVPPSTVSPSVGGVITFSGAAGSTRVNSVGALTRIAGAPVAGGAAGGRHTFVVNASPAYNITATTPLFVRIIDRLSEIMTRETNDPAGLGGVGATAIITPITGTPQSGEISAVTFGRTSPTGEPGTLTTTDAYSAAARITQGTATVGTGNAFVPASLPVYFDPAFVGAPANTVASGTALIEVDPASPRHREIYAINVGATTRGSGYSLGNRWQRLDTGNSVHRTSQPFSVFGGFEGGGINGIYNGHLNQDNIRFDAFTGMTYTRDAHYGTGRLLD